MPRGALINTQTYWTVPGDVDAKGNPKEYTSKPKTGFLGLGINADAPVQHKEELYDNGDVVVSRLDPASDQWVQENVQVDTARQQQYQDEQARATQAATAARQEGRDTAAAARQQATDTRVARAQERQAAAQEAAGRRADESLARQEKRDLTLAEIQQKRLEFDQQVQTGKLRADEAARQFDEWYKTRLLEHQQATDARSQAREDRLAAASERNADLANRREDRLAGAQERQLTIQEQQQQRQLEQQQQNLAFNQQNAALGFGQQRVQNVLSTLPYRVGPGFAGDFSKGLSTLSGGGGQVNFNPSDFTFQMPNLDQAAEEGFRRAMSVFGIGQPQSAVNPSAPGGPLPLPPGYPSMPR